MSLRFAIVGSGPAGFFQLKAIQKAIPDAYVDMIQKLPVPFGLVRYGVSPDHNDVKNVITEFTAAAQHPNFRFFGNIQVVSFPQGRDIDHKTLLDNYSAIIYAYGAGNDKPLQIPGGENSRSAKQLVQWYNGYPESQYFDFSQTKTISIIGMGNVALDVARVIGRDPNYWQKTDIADYAQEVLKKSAVEQINIIGRRGAIQAMMSPKELRYLMKIPQIGMQVDSEDLENSLTPSSIEEAQLDKPMPIIQLSRARKKIWNMFCQMGRIGRVNIKIKLLRSPIKYSDGILTLQKNRLDGDPWKQVSYPIEQYQEIPCDMLIRSIGYEIDQIDPDIPLQNGVVKNRGGRVDYRVYVSGWARTGPFGSIDATVRVSVDTMDTIRQDYIEGKIPLVEENCELFEKFQYFSFDDWLKLDVYETSRSLKPREKAKNLEEMLSVIKTKS